MSISSRTPRREQGFTLIELMITLLVMAAVLGLVFFTLQRSQHQSARVTNVADERQMARTAIQLIEREARMSGSGWGRTPVQGSRSGASWTLGALNPGFGSVNTSDSLTMLGAWQASTALTDSMVSNSSNIVVTSTAGFTDGDLLLVTDQDNKSAHLFQATSVNSGTRTLAHTGASTYNAGPFLGWPAGGYPIGSPVYKVTMSTYKFDSTTYRRPALLRREAGKPWQIVAYNVDGFHVWYLLQDGTWTRNPANMTMVDRVIPVVLTRLTDPRLPTLRDSVYASVRPRTF